MSSRAARLLGFAAISLALCASSGCVFLADLVNRDVLLQLGVDPDTVLRPSGTTIVVFDNQTSSSVQFQFYQTADPTDLTISTRTLAIAVDPQSNTNEVLRCPTGGVSLGIVGANFAVTNTGATITAAGAQGAGTAVTYGGAILREGIDYGCGDVIQFTIAQAAQAGQQQGGFVITARVIPGR